MSKVKIEKIQFCVAVYHVCLSYVGFSSSLKCEIEHDIQKRFKSFECFTFRKELAFYLNISFFLVSHAG
jgi:hypothetical protein